MSRSQTDEFDYVIVGGGTAAGIVAWRLGEAGYSVCVLEAGPPDHNPFIHIPAGFSKTLADPKITWQFKSDPEPGIADRSIVYAQGKTLGGSSAINGMIYNRGQAADFDGWAQAGNTGWSYDEVLPYFRRTENRIGESVDPNYRGVDGRLTVTTTQWPNELETAFYDAAINAGYPHNDDYNGASQEGVGSYQSSISNGWRVSSASAFLKPARRQYKVEVRCNALAMSVILEDKRATGVSYRRGASESVVLAKREVIVSAGTLNSPKLLQLSGIGPAQLLKEHGVEVVHDLPAVGENLRDHFSPRIVARANPGLQSINQNASGLSLVGEVFRWLVKRPSVLAISPGRVHIFGKSSPQLENPDFVLLFAPASYKAGMVDVLDDPKKVKNFLRMEKWIFDSPDQAGETFRQFIKDFYQQNALMAGEVEIGDHVVDLANITCPVLNIYAQQDHLVPPDASTPLGGLVGSDDYKELAFPGGHIGIYVSGRAQKEVTPAIGEWLSKR